MDVERKLQAEYVCPKCGHQGGITKELSMSGTGVSKMPERFIFVSCDHCGFTEIYNTKMLCKQNGVGTDLLDLFFG